MYGLLWWLMPLIPAPDRQRQVASLVYIVLGQPGICRETLTQKGKQASKHVASREESGGGPRRGQSPEGKSETWAWLVLAPVGV